MSPSALIANAAGLFLREASPDLSAIPHMDVDIPTTTAAIATAVATASSAIVETAAAAAAAAAETATTAENEADHGGSGDCRLVGPFALIVQVALGALALLSLVWKRWRERPQRPLKIWFFDVSKQVVGAVLVHVANVFMSMLTSGRFSVKLEPGSVQEARHLMRRDDDQYAPNPCSFYLLNLAIDTTLGIPILLLLLKVTTGLVAYTPFGKPRESIESGNYGSPPSAWWWFKQSVIYFCGLFGMKICVLILFLILPWLSRVGDWALRWTEGNERLQIFFVMMLFPLIMNALQYYIIDSFIKKKEMGDQPETSGHQRLATEENDDDERDPFADALADSDDDYEGSDSGESNGSVKMSKMKDSRKEISAENREEYDPDFDGQTVVGSSRSHDGRGKLVKKEMLPHE